MNFSGIAVSVCGILVLYACEPNWTERPVSSGVPSSSANKNEQTAMGSHSLVPATPTVSNVDVALRLSDVNLSLRPFEVTLSRIADLLGVEVSDPVLANIIAEKFSVGAYDYSQRQQPSIRLNPDQHLLWQQLIAEPCFSERARALDPGEDAGRFANFMKVLYGRQPVANEHSEWLAFRQKAGAEAFGLYCIAQLSSLEFLYK